MIYHNDISAKSWANLLDMKITAIECGQCGRKNKPSIPFSDGNIAGLEVATCKCGHSQGAYIYTQIDEIDEKGKSILAQAEISSLRAQLIETQRENAILMAERSLEISVQNVDLAKTALAKLKAESEARSIERMEAASRFI
jgi:hypothetical protein